MEDMATRHMTHRDQSWLEDALAAFDLLHFDGSLADHSTAIKWHRFRTMGHRTRFAEVRLPKPDAPTRRRVIRVNVVLQQSWVPDYFVLDTVHHEALHVVLGWDHDAAFWSHSQRYVHHAAARAWADENISRFMAECAQACARPGKAVKP